MDTTEDLREEAELRDADTKEKTPLDANDGSLEAKKQLYKDEIIENEMKKYSEVWEYHKNEPAFCHNLKIRFMQQLNEKIFNTVLFDNYVEIRSKKEKEQGSKAYLGPSSCYEITLKGKFGYNSMSRLLFNVAENVGLVGMNDRAMHIPSADFDTKSTLQFSLFT